METRELAGVELLASPVRRRIVDLLAAHAAAVDESDQELGLVGPPGLTAAELAETVGLHLTAVRFHLDLLVAAGLVGTQSRPSGVGRPRKLYAINPGCFDGEVEAVAEDAYRRLATVLTTSWRSDDGTAPTPRQAGRAWSIEHAPHDPAAGAPSRTPGQWLDKIGRMIDLLSGWGYTPEVSTSRGGRRATIKLVDCPFLELAHSRPDVVCAVHRGLIAGAMEAFGETDAKTSLQPFTGPNECLAHVTRKPFDPDATRDHPSGAATTRGSDE